MSFISKKDLKLVKRDPKGHKGDNGRVLVIGGSRDYVGALVLAGLAALRCGVDWVTVAAPSKVGWAVSALSADLVVKKYKGEEFNVSQAKDVLKFSSGFDAVLIGNGIGIKSKSFVKKFVKKNKKLMVIDADGIKPVGLNDVDNVIITPHLKELEMFLENSKIDEKIIKKITNKKLPINKKSIIIRNILKKLNKKIVVLLKGPVDAVISGDRIKLNMTGNAGMTKAGTGDVLAGLCLGYLGQTGDLFQSAVNAAYISGVIGDILLKKKKGFSYIASDMVEEIENIKKKLN
ncbi:MAG: NAD(P)H-hydrate dehydratase [Candidatus Woesearchaeota archaeon]|jgi:NAD(P)H-hydrate epimerase|nr:NAD(P)H-hydrate dehydratase [Candidatus Woesearchaeota archaeon]